MTTKQYQGNLQERLRNLSIKTNCPTRQENGQRYLGPPVDWIENPPSNAEIFISKLPADCYEDEIYDFCSQIGKIYLIRLMINFENENRGFCFVTFSTAKEATEAVTVLPQNPLRKGHYVHAEISFNNCTLKMYGLDFRWNDENLEQEIRTNTKDVVNVTIKRNMAQKTLMATLYFDTHQKAAIARRKLSQIANSRWGQNVKVFLWSKKLQNKGSNKESTNEKIFARKKSSEKMDTFDKDKHFDSDGIYQNEDLNSLEKSFSSDTASYQEFSTWKSPTMFSPPKLDNIYDFNNNKFATDSFKKFDSFKSDQSDLFSFSDGSRLGSVFGSPSFFENSPSVFPYSNESSPGSNSKYTASDRDYPGYSPTWNNDYECQEPSPFCGHSFYEQPYKSSESLTDSFYSYFPEKQIETILKEALEALVLNESVEQQLF